MNYRLIVPGLGLALFLAAGPTRSESATPIPIPPAEDRWMDLVPPSPTPAPRRSYLVDVVRFTANVSLNVEIFGTGTVFDPTNPDRFASLTLSGEDFTYRIDEDVPFKSYQICVSSHPYGDVTLEFIQFVYGPAIQQIEAAFRALAFDMGLAMKKYKAHYEDQTGDALSEYPTMVAAPLPETEERLRALLDRLKHAPWLYLHAPISEVDSCPAGTVVPPPSIPPAAP